MLISATSHIWAAMLQLPLAQRIMPAPAELAGFIASHHPQSGNPAVPASAPVDDALLADLRAAVAGLPAAVTHCVAPRLFGVFLAQDVGSSAASGVVAGPGGEPLGAFIVVDAALVASPSANTWFSWRENTPFAADPSVRIEAAIADEANDNRVAALQFLLLHEIGHVLAACSDLMPDWWEAAPANQPHRYLDLAWQPRDGQAFVPRPGCDFPLRGGVVYYGIPRLPAREAADTYRQLAEAGFPSLYAATSPHEDFADSFAVYVHTALMQRPYSLRIWHDGRLMFARSGYPDCAAGRARATLFDELLAAPASALMRRPTGFEPLAERARTQFVGLAPFLRMSIAGDDLRVMAQLLLDAANRDQDNACLWMNLSTVLFALELQEPGTAVQQQALAMRRTYTRAASRPARFRLLMLMAPGNLAENTPLDCLLEDSPVELLCHFASPHALFPAPLPEHDAVLVAFSDSEANSPILAHLAPLLADWHRPVINRPEHVGNTERARASRLLQGVPGLVMPPTCELAREELLPVARGEQAAVSPHYPFPLIVRPVGSHAGHDLERIADASALAAYLKHVGADRFYVSPFVDYSNVDGQFRKLRVALVDGRPFVSHMAVSSHWMVHYLNAGMYEDAAKRAEEQAFMEGFDDFALRHEHALRAIHERIGLDYICIDCAQTREGELLVFEVDHVMVVHAMDRVELFPFKQPHMARLRQAFENYLFGLPAETTGA